MKKYNFSLVGGGKTTLGNPPAICLTFLRSNISFLHSKLVILYPMAALIMLFYSCNEFEPSTEGRFKDNVYADTRELSDGDCEIPFQVGCDTATIDTFVLIDTCQVPVKFFRKICPDVTGVSFTFGHFVINNNSLQLDTSIYCDNLDTWSAQWALGNYSAAEAAWDNFRKRVSQAVELLVISEYISEFPENYDCESSSSVITISSSFIETECKAICGEQDEEVWYLRDVVCGTGCCVRFTDYCIRDGQLVVDGTHTDSSPGCETVANDCRGTLGNCRNSCAGL